MANKKQPSRQKHIPQRSCIVCRRKLDKRQLTRLVRTDDGVVVDSTGKQNGRGAYLCDQTACWDTILQKKGLLAQALKMDVTAADLEVIAAHKPAAAPGVSLIQE